jgi:ferredoxin-type protein NapH
VWCRFFCPLRAYMEVLSKFISKITIKANDKCIGCGECTRYCQMGIPVQQFAQKREDMDNTNSSCIQCGICIQVCPMEVLSIGERAR